MTSATLFVLLVAVGSVASDPTSDPWNTLPAARWPSTSPWSSWIKAAFVLRAPWSETKCFHAWNDNGIPVESPIQFNAQVDCPLCNNTLAAPGFAPDPNDCNAFYMCTPFGTVWAAHRMKCAKCQFWNQEILTCVPVQSGEECKSDSAVWTGPTAPPPTGVPAAEKRAITCITWDEPRGKLSTNGVWVKNNGVLKIDNAGICKYGKCGYFSDNSTIEIPFFINNYNNYKSFSISMFYAVTGGDPYQGIISNSDCYGGNTKDKANSIYMSSPAQNLLNAGLKTKSGQEADMKLQWSYDYEWHFVVISWDGKTKQVKFYIDNVLVKTEDFSGRIRNTHCPMVLGSFLCPLGPCTFTGTMDQVCFYKTALEADEVNEIYNNPGTIY